MRRDLYVTILVFCWMVVMVALLFYAQYHGCG